MFGLPYLYSVYVHSGGADDHFYVELWNPEFRKYVTGLVTTSGTFMPSNDHLTRKEFLACGSTF